MSSDNAADVSLSETYAREGAPNLGPGERAASVASAAALASIALRRKGISLALLVPAAYLAHRGATGRCAVYGALGVDRATRKARGVARMERGASASVAIDRGLRVEESVVIARPCDEVYALFRDLHALAEVARNVERVEVSSAALSRWTVRGPAGMRLRWDAEVINDRPWELIAWRTRAGSDVRSAGSVRFSPLDDGASTEVRVQFKYDPPGGRVGAALARWFGPAADERVREDLRRVKEALEAAPSTRVDVRAEYGDGRMSSVSIPPPAFPPRRITPSA